MNKNHNKLPRRKVSSGKVTGKIKHGTDIKLITDPCNHITDEFPYTQVSYQFSDFYNKVIQDRSWIDKPRFLLEAKRWTLLQ